MAACSNSPPRPNRAHASCGSPRRSPKRFGAAPNNGREASFPPAAIDVLTRAGYFAAPVPVETGGLGVASVHDVVVASSRLARGDASIAIGVNMHLVVLLNIVRRWLAARAAGDRRRAMELAASMTEFARNGIERYGQPQVPAGTGGGEIDLLAGLFDASVSLGIAESASSAATEPASHSDAPDARTRALIADNVIDLGACRATLSRSAALVDEPGTDAVALFAETQAANAFVNESAARIVDRAIAISGGTGHRTYEATASDAGKLWYLSQITGQPRLRGRVLIGDIKGAPAAAISVADGRIVADASRDTTRLAQQLRSRAEALRALEPGDRSGRRASMVHHGVTSNATFWPAA
jgi:hypothetical protein